MNKKYKIGDFIQVLAYNKNILYYGIILDTNYNYSTYYLSEVLMPVINNYYQAGQTYCSEESEIEFISDENILNKLRKIQTFS